jgi:prepilin-type N-terminal cleavage/methylation domain-containing protein
VKRVVPGGFTLIEVILAALIFSLVSMITWGALHATFKTERLVSGRTELQETGTALLNKIREDLSQAFLVTSPRPLTFFKGEDNQDRDRITFSSLVHASSRPDGRESDETQITYWTESHPAEGQLFLLKRKETPYLDGTEEVEADSLTVTSNLLLFNLEYSGDGQKFVPMWDSKGADQLNKLPRIVRLSMKLRDARGREEYFETVVDLPMSEGIGIQGTSAASSSPTPGGTPGPTPSPTVPAARRPW